MTILPAYSARLSWRLGHRRVSFLACRCRRLVVGASLVLVDAVAPSLRAQTPAATLKATAPAGVPVDAAMLYRTSAPAVFLIEVRSDGQTVLGIGSAFLIGPDRLVTNAHVVQGGTPYLRTGAVALPLAVERLDLAQDLAIVRSPTPLEATPLKLATHEPAVGTWVAVLGNPQGLERSISEGLISGVRERQGHRLLQLSASISPGSSGGPVLGADGAVVGVTVGFLEGGQNLNFAVPASSLGALLTQSVGVVSGRASAAALDEALSALRTAFGAPKPVGGDKEAWQRRFSAIREGLDRAAGLTRTGGELLQVAVLADSMYESERAARFALDAIARDRSLADTARAVAIASLEWTLVLIDSSKVDDLERFLALADSQLAHRPRDPQAHSFRASALDKLGRGAEALAAIRRAIQFNAPGTQADWREYHRLIAKHAATSEDDVVFSRMGQVGVVGAWDWSIHGGHLERRAEWARAAQAYVTAFGMAGADESLRPGYACGAGRNYGLAGDVDRALDAFRTCIEGYERAAYVDTSDVVYAHQVVAGFLNDRNVFTEAERHARQGLALNSSDAWASHELSRALQGEARLPDAARAAEEAIRLSDGRFASMHFQAGGVYFDQQDWLRCARAFAKASDINLKSDAAKYNEALCLAKQGYYIDAARAMEQVLQRNPKRSDRPDILRKIAIWRR